MAMRTDDMLTGHTYGRWLTNTWPWGSLHIILQVAGALRVRKACKPAASCFLTSSAQCLWIAERDRAQSPVHYSSKN